MVFSLTYDEKMLICSYCFQRLLSDISRLEGKVERLEAQLSGKDREIATMTRTVCLVYLWWKCQLRYINCSILIWVGNEFHEQEAKATAAFKSQIDKLQQERDEFQKMVLGNQVYSLPSFFCQLKLLVIMLLTLTLYLINSKWELNRFMRWRRKRKNT